jgi:ABC-type transport system substrate-binding protein
MVRRFPWRMVFSLVVLAVLIAAVGCKRKSVNSTTITILYNAEEQPAEKSAVAQIIQFQLISHGINAKLEPVSNSIYYDRIGKGDFDATLALWYLDYNDPEGFLTDFYSKASFRMAKYNNPEYDKTYLTGLFAQTEAEKFRSFKQAADIIGKDLPWIPLYSNDELFLMHKGAEGFQSNAFQYYDYRHVDLPEIHAASDVEIVTFDPALVYDLGSKHVASQCYEGLVAMGSSAKIIPALAESWKFSPNQDSITFNLRPHVMFASSSVTHSREVVADDVKASFERMLKDNSPYAYIFDYVKGVDEFRTGKASSVVGFEVVNAHTFRIDLTRPFPTMLEWLQAPAAYVLPRNVPANYEFSKGSVGTGPFILTSYDGNVARLVANPNYWQSDGGRRLPLAKLLSIRLIKDVNTEYSAFRKDELDILNVPVALYSQVLTPDGKVKPEWQDDVFRDVPLNNLKFICLNMQRAPWGNSLELRQKFARSLDTKAIVEQLFKGKARTDDSVIPADMWDSGAATH